MEELQINLQGSFLSIFGIGTLITGEPGIGKSELALGLIERKHQLIADDATSFSKVGGKIIGSNPLPRPFLHLRGLGLFDICHLFGPGAIKSCQELQLIIHLQRFHDTAPINDKDQQITVKDLSGCLIPCETIPIINPRNLETLIEIIVKRHLLNINVDWLSKNSFDDLLQSKMEQIPS